MIKILLGLLVTLFVAPVRTNAYTFFSPKQPISHPYLLISKDEVPYIAQRADQLPAVRSALSDIGSTDVSGDKWPRALGENSFKYLVTNDPGALATAVAIVKSKTTGPSRFAFSDFNSEQGKFGFASGCTSLALTYDFIHPELSVDEASALRAVLVEWGRGLFAFYAPQWYLAGHNWHAGTVGCLGLIGLTLEKELPEARQWADGASYAVKNHFFNQRFNPGGDSTDGLVYQNYGYSAPLLFSAAFERNREVDLVSGTNIMNTWDFYTYAYQPFGGYVRFGDNSGQTIINGENFYLFQKHQQNTCLKCSGWLWFWQQIRGQGSDQGVYGMWKEFDLMAIILYYPENVQPAQPTLNTGFPLAKIFPSLPREQGVTANPGGMVSIRSGWGENSVSVWLNNRWSWQGHQHYDPNSFRLSAYGEDLISYQNNRDYADPLRGKLSQQNTILIDKNLYGGDAPIGDFTTSAEAILGKLTDFVDDENVGMISGDSRYASYNLSLQKFTDDFWGNATEETAKPILQAKRTLMLNRATANTPYLLIYDQYNKDNQPREYVWQAYFPKEASNLRGDGSVGTPFYFQKGQVYLKTYFINPTASHTFQLLTSDGARDDRAFQAKWVNTPGLANLTILRPGKVGDNSDFRVQIMQNANPTVIQITDNGVDNLILLNNGGEGRTYNGLRTDAELLVLTRKSGYFVKYAFYNGSYLRANDQSVVSGTSRQSRSGTMTVADRGECPKGALGNLNCDSTGLINSVDLAILLAKWSPLGPVAAPAYSYHSADIVSDGKVNGSDLAKLLRNWQLE